MSETLNGPDFSPLYRQVKDLLLKRVMSGDWKPGEILPSEAKLAAYYHVSQGTVRKALEEMAAEHLVVRRQGRGTFVAARGEGSPVHFFSLLAANHEPLQPRTTVSVECTISPPTEEERTGLQIDPISEVARIYRVRAVGGVPCIIEKIILENARFPGFAQRLEASASANTYVFMEKEYGIQAVRADEWLSACAAEGAEARALNVDPGMPLLNISRVSYSLDGKPMELRTMWVHPKYCSYFNRLS